MQVTEILLITVSQLFALAPGAIAFALSYALAWFPNLDTRIANGIKVVVAAAALALVGYVASLLPDSFIQLKVIDASLMIIGAIVSAIGGTKFGGLKAESHRVQQLDVRAKISAYAKRVVMIIVMLGLVASVFAFAFAPSVSAAGPDDYLPQMVKCSSLPVSVLRVLQQSFDTQYGYDHALTNVFQWQATYEARVNQFAVLFGCPPPLANGALTFWYRVYDPIYDVPTVSGLSR